MGKLIGFIVCAIGVVFAFEGIQYLMYGGIIYSLFCFAIGAFLLSKGAGLFSGRTGSNKQGNYGHSSINTRARGRSCFDCKHCNTKRAKNEQIYCSWDSEYYFPETGLSCDDFNK